MTDSEDGDDMDIATVRGWSIQAQGKSRMKFE
jgi:hypothetical protein